MTAPRLIVCSDVDCLDIVPESQGTWCVYRFASSNIEAEYFVCDKTIIEKGVEPLDPQRLRFSIAKWQEDTK